MNEDNYTHQSPHGNIQGLDTLERDPRPQIQMDGARENAPAPGLGGSALARMVVIEPINHGFIITCGCQRFAIETTEALLHRLNVYYKNPAETEKKWMAGEWKW